MANFLLKLALACVFFPSVAQAHDIYTHLMQPDNPDYSCCSGDEKTGDCRPVQTKWEHGHWLVPLEGKWTPVPDKKVMDSPDSRAHLCEQHGHIYCFLKPEAGS